MWEVIAYLVGLVFGVGVLVYAAIRAGQSASRSTKAFEQYIHHESRNWVRSDLKGKHRDHCLCYDCVNFHPGDPDANCSTAQDIYENCVERDLVTPVWECPGFRQDAFADDRPWNNDF